MSRRPVIWGAEAHGLIESVLAHTQIRAHTRLRTANLRSSHSATDAVASRRTGGVEISIGIVARRSSISTINEAVVRLYSCDLCTSILFLCMQHFAVSSLP